MTDARTYHSPLRQRQALATRHAILSAAADLIVEEGLDDFSLREVAVRAEVSERTVYNHFANRDAVLDGLAEWVDDRLREAQLQQDPREIDDVASRITAIFRAFDEIGAPARAMARLAAARGTESERARERTAAFRDRFADVLDPLPDREAERSFAVLRHVVSSGMWLVLRDRFGLSSDDAAEAIRWALETLLADLCARAEDEAR